MGEGQFDMSGNAGRSPARPGAPGEETWREAVAREIVGLGWERQTRVELPSEEVTLYVFDTHLADSVAFTPEGPPTFSVSVVLEGRGTFSVEGAKPLTLAPGLGILFTSSSYCRGYNSIPGDQRVHLVDMRFEKSLLLKAGGPPLARLGGDLLTEHSRPESGVFLIGFEATPSLMKVAQDIAGCSLPEGLSRRLYLQSKAIEALSAVVLALQMLQAPQPALRADARRKLERARLILEESYQQDWTIIRLAREVGLSERTLKAGFRRLVGNSVHAHLRDIRLNAAASLLAEGHSVTEAALSVGFENLSHFSKVFRAAKGVTPRRYRDAHRRLLGHEAASERQPQ